MTAVEAPRTLTLFEASPAARMAQPRRCRCEASTVPEFAATLACPLVWWPVPGGWAHLPYRPRRRLRRVA